jgi:DNA-binding NtrC family response regulator
MTRLLVVDDDPELLQNLCELFAEEGFEVVSAATGADAVSLAKARAPDLIVCDIAMPGVDGYAVLEALRAHPATTSQPFVFLSARAERSDVRLGMNLGADDYVTKPFEPGELLDAVRARLRRMSEQAARTEQALRASPEHARERTSPGMVLVDPGMQQLYAQVEQVADSQLNVLILGETGVGKEVLARSLHDRSPRREAAFLPLNCAALSESLLEAELFGHEKGAFTGAGLARPGLLETAHGGTVFLDEVGELPLSIQTKLLRVLEDRQILRVGGRAARAVDVRFVAATNRDLQRAIRDKTFREDLFYRLNGISFEIPPLRARSGEVAPLARMFATRAAVAHGRAQTLDVSAPALERLERYEWPGNVRQLRNVMERAVVLCKGATIQLEHLPPELTSPARSGPPAAPPELDRRAQLNQELEALERERLLEALSECGGNQSAAAERLGVSRRTLVYRLTALGLTRPRKRDE